MNHPPLIYDGTITPIVLLKNTRRNLDLASHLVNGRLQNLALPIDLTSLVRRQYSEHAIEEAFCFVYTHHSHKLTLLLWQECQMAPAPSISTNE